MFLSKLFIENYVHIYCKCIVRLYDFTFMVSKEAAFKELSELAVEMLQRTPSNAHDAFSMFIPSTTSVFAIFILVVIYSLKLCIDINSVVRH